MLKNLMLRMNAAKEGADGSATGYETPPPAETPPASSTPPKEAGNTDEFGYETNPPSDQSGKEGDGKKEAGKEGTAAPAAKEEQPDSVSGYDEDPAKVDPPAAPTDDKKTEEPKKEDGLGYELETKDLDPKEAEKIINLAKTHKLSEEAAKAVLEMKKSEIADAKKAELE
ncbi:MAG: hypothetical protein ACKOX6_16795, partial [Bdellovibrio sp.]